MNTFYSGFGFTFWAKLYWLINPELQCFGTEPFWVASVYQDQSYVSQYLGEETIEAERRTADSKRSFVDYAQNFVSDSMTISTLRLNVMME
jgi:hypothetical protein